MNCAVSENISLRQPSDPEFAEGPLTCMMQQDPYMV